MSKRRNTEGKPNLREWFLYHTKLGRFYNDFEDETDRLIIRCVVAGGLLSFGVLVYIVIALVS